MRRIALCLSLLASLSCDNGNSSDKASKSKVHSPEDVAARAEEVYGVLEAIHTNLPDTGATKQACPDDKIKEWGAEGREKKMTFLAYQSLRRSVGEPWDGNNSLVGFMTDSNVRYPPRAEFALDKERNIKQLMRMWNFVHYIGVIVPVEERKAKAVSAHVGDAGALEAQLVIYRKGEPKPICHAPLSVRGKGNVSYRYNVADNSNDKKSKAQYALKKDLCRELAKVLKEEISGLSKVLEAGFIDCNGV